MKKPTVLSNKCSTAWSCAEDQIFVGFWRKKSSEQDFEYLYWTKVKYFFEIYLPGREYTWLIGSGGPHDLSARGVVGSRCLSAGSVGCRLEVVHGKWLPMSTMILAKGWRVQGVTRCDWGSRYWCLYYSCPWRDNAAQSYHHWGRRQWSWLSVYTPCIWGCVPCWYFAQTPSIRGPFEECVLSNHLLSCGVKRYVQAWCHLGVSTWK